MRKLCVYVQPLKYGIYDLRKHDGYFKILTLAWIYLNIFISANQTFKTIPIPGIFLWTGTHTENTFGSWILGGGIHS